MGAGRWKVLLCSCFGEVICGSFEKKFITRLELLGCLRLYRIYSTCKEAFEFVEIDKCKKVFWVDLLNVLSWIKNLPREFKPFVLARVAEIQETIDVENFAYIQSKDKTTDALTRGINADLLHEWIEGPSFLQLSEDNWPDFKEVSLQREFH